MCQTARHWLFKKLCRATLNEPLKWRKYGKIGTFPSIHLNTWVCGAVGCSPSIEHHCTESAWSSPARKWFGSRKMRSRGSPKRSPDTTRLTAAWSGWTVTPPLTGVGFPIESTHCKGFWPAVALPITPWSKFASYSHSNQEVGQASTTGKKGGGEVRNPLSAEGWPSWPSNTPGELI